MAMTQMMCAEKWEEAQTEKEARHPRRQPNRQASSQADGQAKAVGRGCDRARSRGQMQPCERNRWLVESASPRFLLRGSTHGRCGLSLSQPLAGEEGQSQIDMS
jgi:hypothetical protein